MAGHFMSLRGEACRYGGPTLLGHCPPDSVGESLRVVSRARLVVAASHQNAPVSR
jgi:hypothetical protein